MRKIQNGRDANRRFLDIVTRVPNTIVQPLKLPTSLILTGTMLQYEYGMQI